MSQKESLRRFAKLRRIRRRGKMSPQGQTDSPKTVSKRRIVLNVRTLVFPSVPTRLSAAGKALHLSQPRLIGNILEWFAVQSNLVQALVVARR